MDKKYIGSLVVVLVMIGLIVWGVSRPSADYRRGYTYGQTTGNSYAAPLLPSSDFNKGAAQGAKHQIMGGQ